MMASRRSEEAGSAPGVHPFWRAPLVRKTANLLLDQQFWLWGCDIRRREGNILTHLGFEKIKAPAETGLGTSQYRCPLSATSSIALWGFGVCLGENDLGSVFIPRAGLLPRLSPIVVDTAPAWEPAWFDRLPPPNGDREMAPCHHLVHRLVDWIAWYEDRVLEIAGAAHRQRSLEAWKRPVGDPLPLANQWRQLGIAIRGERG